MRLLLLASLALALTPGYANPTKPAKKPVKSKAVVPTAAVEPETLDEERMAVVPRVLVGEIPCEFGRTVRVDPHPQLSGRFVLTLDKIQAIVTPQPTTTGVIRLENAQAGLVWLQVPVKSMLMNAKLGQRMADNCLHTAQAAELEALKSAEVTEPPVLTQ